MNDSSHIQEKHEATELVRRISGGDSRAEAETIDRYSRGLRFLLRQRVRDPQLVEDFLQETWSIALPKLRRESLKEPGRLAGYLRGIAVHLAQGDRRRVQRQRTSVNTEIIDLVPDESNNPFRHVSRAEICQQVRKLLDGLKKERDREILRRFYVNDEDKESICSYLGVDSLHFNRVLYRARQRLKSAVMASDRRSQFRIVE